MTYELPVKMTNSGPDGVALITTSGGPLHQLDLWYSNAADATGYGRYNRSTKLTTWTIILNQATTDVLKLVPVNSHFTFVWGPSLSVVDMAVASGTPTP